MFNKKCIAKFAALALTLSCLTACAGTGAGTIGAAGDQTDQQAESTTAEAAAADNAAGSEAADAAADTAKDTAGAEEDAAKDTAADAAAADAAGATDYTTGTPWLCIDLEGVVTPDTPADLKDNFALAVNKEKILNLEIPEGHASGGTMTDLELQQAEDVKKMFLGETPAEHDAKLAYDLFWMMMDWDSRNALGVAPLKEKTDKIEAISTIDGLMDYFAKTPPEKQLTVLWRAGTNTDFNDSSRYILAVADPGVLLRDSAEYKKLTPFGKTKKDAYTALAQKMLVKLGYSEEEAAQKIDNSFAFETMAADTIYTNEEMGKADYITRINNIYSREELQKLQGKLPILAALEEGMGFPAAEKYLIANPSYIEKLNELCVDENLPLIRDMLIVKGAISEAGKLDRECYEWNVECGNAIKGSAGMLDDETVFSGSVAETLVWPVARLYTETYLKQEDKDRISEMVDDILAAYHGILEDADFLSDETRAKAVEKLNAIGKHILYPDDWSKYSCEELNFPSKEEGGNYQEALEAITSPSTRKNGARLRMSSTAFMTRRQTGFISWERSRAVPYTTAR